MMTCSDNGSDSFSLDQWRASIQDLQPVNVHVLHFSPFTDTMVGDEIDIVDFDCDADAVRGQIDTSALHDMVMIGWSQFFYGRWAKAWSNLQSEYLIQQSMNHGSVWVQLHIATIWQDCHYAWQSRNADRHSFDEATNFSL
jgi:hypothetical protein